MGRGVNIRRPALWQLYLGAGALLAALYVWVPPFAGTQVELPQRGTSDVHAASHGYAAASSQGVP